MGSPVIVLDSLGDSIEVPLLGSDIVSPSLQPDIVGTVALSNSVEWEFGDEIEWSVDMETEVLVQSLCLWSLRLIDIDNIPLLTSGSLVAINLNWGTFTVIVTFDIKSFTGLPIDELVVLVLEYLPPVRVGAPDLHVVGSTIALDVERLVVVPCSYGQRLLVEVPDLGSSAIWSLDDHVSVVDQIKVSVIWE